jgi:adenylylsulfate kinase-like enzyme
MQITAIWITGRSGAGKSTLAAKLASQMDSCRVVEGDKVRRDFNDEDFTPAGSRNHIERMVTIALNLEKAGIIPIIDCVSREKRFRNVQQSKFKHCLEIQLKGGTTWKGLDYED